MPMAQRLDTDRSPLRLRLSSLSLNNADMRAKFRLLPE
jgi:hypothetical protein